jgi:putative hydrolase of the HAD superfamily
MAARVLMVDVDGVLVNARPRVAVRPFANVEAQFGVTLERLQAEMFEPHWAAIVTGREKLMDRLVPALNRIAPGISAQELVDYWFANDTIVDEDVRSAIRHYRSVGRRVFLCTNQEHMRAAYLMDTVGLRADLDGILYSADLGDRKPGASFFRLAAERAGATGNEIAFVDDVLDNVEAARRAGWTAVHWTAGGNFRETIDPLMGL